MEAPRCNFFGTFSPGSCHEPGPKGLHMRWQARGPTPATFSPGSCYEPGLIIRLYHLLPTRAHHFLSSTRAHHFQLHFISISSPFHLHFLKENSPFGKIEATPRLASSSSFRHCLFSSFCSFQFFCASKVFDVMPKL